MLTLPKIVEFQARKYVATRLNVVVPFDSEIDPAFDELWDAFRRAGVEPDGIEFIKFNLIDMPRLEIEVGMTTESTLSLSGRLVQGELPGGRYVSSTYTGSYDGLYDGTADLLPWNVLGLRLVCSPEKETENEAFPFQRRADHRYFEGAPGRAFGC